MKVHKEFSGYMCTYAILIKLRVDYAISTHFSKNKAYKINFMKLRCHKLCTNPQFSNENVCNHYSTIIKI